LALTIVAGCATGAGSKPSASAVEPAVDTSQRVGFMGLNDEPLAADWNTWTPTPGLAATSVPSFVAFDSWRVTDSEHAEQLWMSTFTLLDVSRGYLPDAAAPTVRALMTVLDPGASSDVVVDVVFVVARDGESEGALVRTYRQMPNGGTPGVVLELQRRAGGGDNPDTMVLHLHAGYAEAQSYEVVLSEPDSIKWRARGDDPWNTQSGEAIATELAVVRDIVAARFWLPLIGTRYMEPTWPIARGEEARDSANAPDFPAGHGEPVELRPIDLVLTDTVFPPRLDL
jgi:hypothetical protein